MSRIANAKPKTRRLAAVLAVLVFAGALGGCVVERGPGYVGVHHWHHDDD
jgi:hypothetical protein